MSRVPDQVLAWLHRVLQPEYASAQRAFDDVAETLYHFPSLKPRTDIYTFQDGETRLLLLLHGSIPTQGRSSLATTPIHVWLPHAYPQAAPIVLINPGPGMVVNPSNYVDINRMCYHPYLAYWTKDSGRHNLRDALIHFQQAFEREPPLHQLEYTNVDLPSRIGAVPPPVRPAKQAPSTENQVMPKNTADPLDSLLRPTGQSIPRAPPRPSVRQVSVDVPPTQAFPSSQLVPKPPTKQGSESIYREQPIQQSQQLSAPNVQGTRPRTPSLRKMVERKPVPLLTPSQESLAHPNASPVEPSSAALAKLADALQTIASKNEKRFEATRKTGLLALDRLKAHVASLEQSQKLHARISADSARNEEILSDRLAKAKAVIQEMDLTADPDVDEFLIAQNRVYNQLYELTSEEAAIDDTIYALGRALEDEQIELGLFLKHSRSLAREQFLKRALILKISDLLELDL